MKGILIVIIGCVLMSSMVVALDRDRVPITNLANEYCINQGHFLETYVWSFGTYSFCVDSYENECEANRYYLGDCELVENTKEVDKLFDSLLRLETKDLTRCSNDSDCTMIDTGKCKNGCGLVSVNDKGLNYYSLWDYFYTKGDYACLMYVCPITAIQPKCIEKECKLI